MQYINDEWIADVMKILPEKQEILDTPMKITLTLRCNVGDIFSRIQSGDAQKHALYSYCDNDSKEDMWAYVKEYLLNELGFEPEELKKLLDKYLETKETDTSLDLTLWE